MRYGCLLDAQFGKDTILTGAEFNGAKLQDANLTNVFADGADFQGATLTGTDFSEAIITGCDFRKVLDLGTLVRADLSNTDLRDPDLSGADFSGAILINANLRGANFKNVDFSGADLTGANIIEADVRKLMREAKLTEAIMPDGRKYEVWLEEKSTDDSKRRVHLDHSSSKSSEDNQDDEFVFEKRSRT